MVKEALFKSSADTNSERHRMTSKNTIKIIDYFFFAISDRLATQHCARIR
jgi:hypothetical protein